MESDNVLIMGHKIPDMDCIGAAVGLADACRENGRTPGWSCRTSTSRFARCANISEIRGIREPVYQAEGNQ